MPQTSRAAQKRPKESLCFDTDQPDTLNCAQVGELLGHNEQIVRQMAREGPLPAHRPGGLRANGRYGQSGLAATARFGA